MLSSTHFKKLALCSMTTALLAASQSSLAHTRLEKPIILEGTRVYNNVAIGHGCGDVPVMGTSVVFPDASATVTSKPAGQDAEPTPNGAVTDWILGSGEGYVSQVYSKEVFSAAGVKTNSLGNTVGFWAGGGALPPHNAVGLIPFRTNPININPESCAKTVTIVVPISDVCSLSTIDEFSDDNVNMWTPAVGSNFDGIGLKGEDSPATLKIVRNIDGTLATPITAAVAPNPLPESCGDGLDITITPTADQINRDMPAVENGVQVWPAQ